MPQSTPTAPKPSGVRCFGGLPFSGNGARLGRWMNSPARATVPLTGSPRQGLTGQWRDTPKAKAYFQAWGKVWGGKDGLIAQAARHGKGQ